MALLDQNSQTKTQSSSTTNSTLSSEAKLASVQQMLDAELESDRQPALEVARPHHIRPVARNVYPGLKVSIVIPAFNEQETILEVLSNVQRLPLDKEIIVVDDASTDSTYEKLKSLEQTSNLTILRNEANQGKGASVRRGLEAATGDVLAIQDADLEYDCSEITELIHPIACQKADVVYGSRFLCEDNSNSSWLHRFGNGLLTRFSNWMTGLKLTDMETCYKVIRRTSFDGIQLKENRFGMEPELTAKLAGRGCRFVEMPISYCGRDWKDGKKIGIKDLFRALYCIARYRK